MHDEKKYEIHKIFNSTVLAVVIMSLFTVSYNLTGGISDPEIGNADIIATVIGHPISAKDIIATEIQIKGSSIQDRTRGVVTAKAVMIQKIEMSNLRRNISRILWPQLLQDFSINVTQQEIDNGMKTMIQKYHPYEVFDKQKKENKRVIDAIDMVFTDHGDPSIAYEKYLKNDIPRSTWDSEIKYFDDPEIRKEFKSEYEREMHATKSDVESDLRSQVKGDIEDGRLKPAILNFIAKSDTQAQKDLTTINSEKPDLESPANQSLRIKYDAWWQSTFKKDVVVVDHKYDDVFQSLSAFVPYNTESYIAE